MAMQAFERHDRIDELKTLQLIDEDELHEVVGGGGSLGKRTTRVMFGFREAVERVMVWSGDRCEMCVALNGRLTGSRGTVPRANDDAFEIDVSKRNMTIEDCLPSFLLTAQGLEVELFCHPPTDKGGVRFEHDTSQSPSDPTYIVSCVFEFVSPAPLECHDLDCVHRAHQTFPTQRVQYIKPFCGQPARKLLDSKMRGRVSLASYTSNTNYWIVNVHGVDDLKVHGEIVLRVEFADLQTISQRIADINQEVMRPLKIDDVDLRMLKCVSANVVANIKSNRDIAPSQFVTAFKQVKEASAALRIVGIGDNGITMHYVRISTNASEDHGSSSLERSLVAMQDREAAAEALLKSPLAAERNIATMAQAREELELLDLEMQETGAAGPGQGAGANKTMVVDVSLQKGKHVVGVTIVRASGLHKIKRVMKLVRLIVDKASLMRRTSWRSNQAVAEENNGVDDDDIIELKQDMDRFINAAAQEEPENNAESNLNNLKHTAPHRKYVLTRLYHHDKELFADNQNSVKYTTICPKVDGRQPIVLTEAEKKHIDEVSPGSYGDHFVKTGSRPDSLNYYICPEVWCPRSAISMTLKQYNERKCPERGEVPIVFDAKYWSGSKTSQRHPGLLDQKYHSKRMCMPCCFKKPQHNDKCSNPDQVRVWSASSSSEELKISDETLRYVKGADVKHLEDRRFGMLPSVLSSIIRFGRCGSRPDGSGQIGKSMQCMVRMGVGNACTRSLHRCVARASNIHEARLVENMLADIDILKFATSPLCCLFNDRIPQEQRVGGKSETIPRFITHDPMEARTVRLAFDLFREWLSVDDFEHHSDEYCRIFLEAINLPDMTRSNPRRHAFVLISTEQHMTKVMPPANPSPLGSYVFLLKTEDVVQTIVNVHNTSTSAIVVRDAMFIDSVKGMAPLIHRINDACRQGADSEAYCLATASGIDITHVLDHATNMVAGIVFPELATKRNAFVRFDEILALPYVLSMSTASFCRKTDVERLLSKEHDGGSVTKQHDKLMALLFPKQKRIYRLPRGFEAQALVQRNEFTRIEQHDERTALMQSIGARAKLLRDTHAMIKASAMRDATAYHAYQRARALKDRGALMKLTRNMAYVDAYALASVNTMRIAQGSLMLDKCNEGFKETVPDAVVISDALANVEYPKTIVLSTHKTGIDVTADKPFYDMMAFILGFKNGGELLRKSVVVTRNPDISWPDTYDPASKAVVTKRIATIDALCDMFQLDVVHLTLRKHVLHQNRKSNNCYVFYYNKASMYLLQSNNTSLRHRMH